MVSLGDKQKLTLETPLLEIDDITGIVNRQGLSLIFPMVIDSSLELSDDNRQRR